MNPRYLSPAMCSWERRNVLPAILQTLGLWAPGAEGQGLLRSERAALNDLPFLSEWELGAVCLYPLWGSDVLR